MVLQKRALMVLQKGGKKWWICKQCVREGGIGKSLHTKNNYKKLFKNKNSSDINS